MMAHRIADASTASAHVAEYQTKAERAAGLEAACRLMALHDRRRDILLKMAEDWAAQVDKGESV